MLVHVRQALLLKSLRRVLTLCCKSADWQRVASELQVQIGRQRMTRHEGVVYVCSDIDGLLSQFESKESYLEEVMLCGTCQEMRMCREYDKLSERAAEEAFLLTGEWSEDGQWSWSAPARVVEAAGVRDPKKSDLLLQRFDVTRASSGEGLIGMLKNASQSIVFGERERFEQLLQGARGRVQRNVKKAAGNVAAEAAGQVFDSLADEGAKRLYDAIRNLGKKDGHPSGGAWAPSNHQDVELDSAESLLELRWPYSPEQLEAAFKAAALRSHPDRGGSSSAMASVNQARALIRRVRFNA